MRLTHLFLVVTLALAISACSKKKSETTETGTPGGAGDSAAVDARPGMIPATTTDSVTGSGLARGPWRWVATHTGSGRVAPINPWNFTVEFLPDSTITAQVVCNKGASSYQLDGQSIRIGSVVTTRMRCPEASADANLDLTFAQQLEAANRWSMKGDTLLIDSGVGSMRFIK